MKKSIYVYFNANDIAILLRLVVQNGAILYNEKKIEVNTISAISKEVEISYIGYNKECFIKVTSCLYILNRIQPAVICIENKDDLELWNLFATIKRYIRERYMISQDKSYYIGPGIYQDWLYRKYLFPVLFQYDRIVVDEKKMELILKKILEEGYLIKANDVKIKNRDEIDFLQDSFIICENIDKLLTTIIRKRIIRYEYGSDCIFVYRRKKEYILDLDRRITMDAFSKIPVLFENIRNVR